MTGRKLRLRRPLLLSADNFTPQRRTPWGGTRILGSLKTDLGAPAGRVVGESWEVSVEPDFPSRVEPDGAPLTELLSADPVAALGREAARGRSATALLVKLLDAADVLSVQIHPADGWSGLGEDEAGKPESWYVVDREPGAGLYLGLRRGVSRARMEAVLAEGGDASGLLFFVPVEPGDFFVIEAGTAHAIGAGLLLVEPQHVAPGRRGVTYRYWDWNRRYDAEGRPSDAGAPRELHVAQALAVTDWDAPREDALLSRIRLRAGAPEPSGQSTITPLSGPRGGVPSEHLSVLRLHGTGELALPDEDALRGLTVLAGRVTLEGEGYRLDVTRGRSAVLPACLQGVRAHLEGAHALLCAIV